MRLRPKTGEHDIQVVLSKIRKFAGEGDKIKVRIRFRGREIYHPEVARDLLQRVSEEVADAVDIESRPAFEGNSMIMIMAPKDS